MAMIRPLKWFGTACALSGALLVAANVPVSGWGFALFLASSASWLAVAAVTKDGAQAAMQAGFTAANLLGIWRWLI